EQQTADAAQRLNARLAVLHKALKAQFTAGCIPFEAGDGIGAARRSIQKAAVWRQRQAVDALQAHHAVDVLAKSLTELQCAADAVALIDDHGIVAADPA